MPLTVPAPPFLVQLFIKTGDGNGFSENYWVNGDSYEGTRDLVTAATGLVKLRRAMFTENHYVAYIRVSDSQKKRDTVIASYTSATGKGEYVPLAGDTSPDEVALLARTEGKDGDGTPYFALRPFRLLPEECVTDGKFSPTANYTAAFDALEDWMQLHAKLVVKVNALPTALDVTSMKAQHASRRKVGRPFDQLRGRLLRP